MQGLRRDHMGPQKDAAGEHVEKLPLAHVKPLYS